jgi:hypothetical protein
MPVSTPQLRRFVRRTLVTTAGEKSPTYHQLLHAFGFLCQRLRGQLQPLFGAPAVASLFARAHHLTTTEFPWLSDVIPVAGDQCALQNGSAAAAGGADENLQEALAALLANEIGLLSAFIGEDLVMPLVQQAWSTSATTDYASGEN